MAEVGWRLDGPDGAPVVILGGSLGTTTALWELQLAALTARRRVLRFELPGHGGAPADGLPEPGRIADLADRVTALADALGIARFAYAGLSLGGMIGMQLAATRPDRVSSLVLLSTSAFVDAAPWLERMAGMAVEDMEAIADLVLPQFFTDTFLETRPDVVAEVRSMVTGVDPAGYAACARAIAAMDLRERLPSITAPTLVIAGADDGSTTPAHALDLVTRIPDARLVVIASAGHLVNLEQPAAVTEALVGHLRGDANAYRDGLAARRSAMGAAYVDAAISSTSSFRAPFDDYVTRAAWGMVWTRDGLDLRTRSCVTIAMLTALGRLDELALHVVAARRNGTTVEEIREVLLQAAVYCGAPAARSAFLTAEHALADAHLLD